MICVLGIPMLWGCPVYELLGICCPLCGTTRAWGAALAGDFILAFRCHMLFPVTPLWFLAIVLYDGSGKKNRLAEAFLIGIAALLAIYNLMRIFGWIDSAVC